VGGEVEGDRLGKAAEVGHAKDDLVGTVAALEFAEVGENLAIGGVQEAEGTTAEDLEQLAQGDHVAGPVEEAGLVAELGFDVDGLIAVDGSMTTGR